MALTKVSSGVIQTNINLDTHDIVSTGIITATKFVGDGSELTGGAGGGQGALSGNGGDGLVIIFYPE